MPKYYLTTPIYYVNDRPHVGHAYSTIVADALARWHRMKGEDVFFLTGTDENSQKNVEAAAASGEKDLTTYLDSMSAAWQMTWSSLALTNDDFIRTTEERHTKAVIKFWKAVEAAGDIYEGEYSGLYCTGCEAFLVVADLVDGKCAIHKTVPATIKEQNYFFRASKYRDAVLAHIESHPEFIQPITRRKEIVNYLTSAFADISISRRWKTSEYTGGVAVGIPVPNDPAQAIYVWFDALINYLTAVGYGTNQRRFETLWPADLHIVGKDILKFHAALWPAMLLSAGLELPARVFAHGFFTVNGQKMSKSLGNVTNPIDVVGKYGNDALRYFLMREIPFRDDGDFSLTKLEQRYTADLQHGIGNLARRIITLGAGLTSVDANLEAVERHPVVIELKRVTAEAWSEYTRAMDGCAPHEALETIWERAIRILDETMEREKPWQKDGDEHARVAVLWGLLESLRHVAWMLWPLLPQTAEAIFRSLGVWTKESERTLVEAQQWGSVPLSGSRLERGAPLFPPITGEALVNGKR